MHDSPVSGERLAHAHKDLVHHYQALFCCPANFNIIIGPGDEARYSPERSAAFDCIKFKNLTEENIGSSIGLQAMCSTKWTVRGDAVESIIITTLFSNKYLTIHDMKGSVQAQRGTFNVLFGMQLAMNILKITDHLAERYKSRQCRLLKDIL